MAGEAKTQNFMLGTATVMLGAQSDLFDLNAAEHSIGLVKNFQLQSNPSFQDLRQGRMNKLVYSLMTENTVNASCEVYEYTAKNVAYALGLNGVNFAAQSGASTISGAINGGSVPTADVPVATGDGLNFSADDWVMIDQNDDLVTIRQVESIATDTLTMKNDINVDIASGSPIRVVNAIDVGKEDTNNYFAVKVVGRLANGEPVALLLPKVKLTGGINMQFQTNDYGNLPFEMTMFDLTSSDPNYSLFQDRQALLLRQ